MPKRVNLTLCKLYLSKPEPQKGIQNQIITYIRSLYFIVRVMGIHIGVRFVLWVMNTKKGCGNHKVCVKISSGVYKEYVRDSIF